MCAGWRGILARVSHAQERHQRWQEVFQRALGAQQVVAFDGQEREDLSWSMADASAAQHTWAGVRAAVLNELAHQGVGCDHGVEVLPALAGMLLRALEDDPEPPTSAGQGSPQGWLARRRATRAAQRACWYTVHPWRQDAVAERAVVRALLQTLRPWAEQVQSDLPLECRARWPPAVAAAADHLARVSPGHHGDSEKIYATTGWLPADDEASWQAFVLLAPYALGSDVLNASAKRFIDVDDEGTSLALLLNAEQQHLVAAVLDGRRLHRLP